jgi:hypothetical protein
MLSELNPSSPGTPTATQGGNGDDPDVRHSDDFRSVVWCGKPYTFTKNQAACVRVLWAAWEADTPELDGLTVVTQTDVSQARLVDVFKRDGTMHQAWNTMIVPGTTKGSYRLITKPIVAAEPRRKNSRKTPRKTPR